MERRVTALGGEALAPLGSSSFVEGVKQLYGEIYVIVAPPRSCSTLLSRALWNSFSIAYYSHEPFDVVYHRGLGLDEVLTKLRNPVDLAPVSAVDPAASTAILVKELPFQVGRYFPVLASLTEHPVVFLLRDPRRTIESRMRMRAAGGQEPVFPVVESGWPDLARQMAWCAAAGVPYLVVDAADLLRSPARILAALCDRLGVGYEAGMVHWEPVGDVDLALALDVQRHWNERVLSSHGIEPPDDVTVLVEDFPTAGGMRAHVEESLATYKRLLDDPNRVA